MDNNRMVPLSFYPFETTETKLAYTSPASIVDTIWDLVSIG